jgi:hypothetical protein
VLLVAALLLAAAAPTPASAAARPLPNPDHHLPTALPSDPAAVWPNITGYVPDLDCTALPGWPADALAAEAEAGVGESATIPPALHFVWVGGRSALPDKYCANLASFAACLAADPAWTINLWTDAPAPACVPAGVAVRNATAFIAGDAESAAADEGEAAPHAHHHHDPGHPPTTTALAAAMAARPNVGFKADLLRYALLARLGGVYSDIDATCLRSPAAAWRVRRAGGFVSWTGDPYNNLSNAAQGFPARSAVAAAVLACALAHSPTTPHTFIPYVSGPSFFTTAVAQAVGAHPLSGGGGGGKSATVRHHAPSATAHHPRHARHRHHLHPSGGGGGDGSSTPPSSLLSSVRLFPQPLFLSGQAVDGVPPYTVQTNDYNWKE